MKASGKGAIDEGLIVEEVKEQGYSYLGLLERREHWTVYLLEKGKKSFRAKVFSKKELFSSPVLSSGLNREVTVGEMIRHNFNYLVSYADFFYTKHFAIILYDHCPFGPLKTLLTYGELQLEEIFLILRDIFNGLEELKFLGVLHKHLSPDCILIDEKFALKIGGYEFCEPQTHKTMIPPDFIHFQKIMTEAHCVPPEALVNKVCTFKAPMFSLGVILYALFHGGSYPLKDETVDQIKIRYFNKDVQFQIKPELEGLRELKMIFHGLLQPDPRDRMSFVEIRDFVNRMYVTIKDHEEHVRMRMLGKVRTIKEKLQTQGLPTINKGSRQSKSVASTGAPIEMKRYESVFKSPLPASSSIKKLYKLPKDASKESSDWKMVTQAMDMAESLRKPEVGDVVLKANIPVEDAMRYAQDKKKNERMISTPPDTLGQTARLGLTARQRLLGVRIGDYKRVMPRSKQFGETARSTQFMFRREPDEQYAWV